MDPTKNIRKKKRKIKKKSIQDKIIREKKKGIMFECHLLFPCRHCCRRCCCRRRRRGDDDDGSCRMLDTAASSSGSNYRRIYTTIKGRFPFNISLFCFLSSSTTKENLHPTNQTLGCLHHHHHHQKLLNLSKW